MLLQKFHVSYSDDQSKKGFNFHSSLMQVKDRPAASAELRGNGAATSTFDSTTANSKTLSETKALLCRG